MSTTTTAAPRRNLRRLVGVGLLALVGVGLAVSQFAGGAPATVAGPVGGEKLGFLDDPDVVEILRERYDLIVDPERAGSLEMVREVDPEADFLWPSSEVALALYEENNDSVEDVNIFNSPIVLYSWGRVTDALAEEGLVTQDGEVYEIDLAALVADIQEDRQWADVDPELGLFGGVAVQTTNPDLSNSGNMFSGLLANTLNGGEVVNEASVGSVIGEVADIYDDLGNLEDSSGELFTSFLQQGEGAFPLIAGYESQLVEFGLQNEQYVQQVQERVRILYPQPTVWSSHPLIPLNAEGERLRDALLDDEIQQIAWERHGFRAGTLSGEEDPSVLDFVGIPGEIDSVIQMPSPAVMTQIAEAASG